MMLSTCRFHPTCSQYALEALHHEGAWRSARLITRRLLRCLPWPRRSSWHDPAS